MVVDGERAGIHPRLGQTDDPPVPGLSDAMFRELLEKN
jgi:hypothetical protein